MVTHLQPVTAEQKLTCKTEAPKDQQLLMQTQLLDLESQEAMVAGEV
jgi:hypothetical protein